MPTFSDKIDPDGLPRRVVLLAYPGFTLLDVAGPAQVFAEAASAVVGAPAAYELILTSQQGGLLQSDTGISVDTISLNDVARAPIDTLLIAGGPGVFDAAENPALTEWVRDQASYARRVGSVCVGAFVMAASGLLTGRRAVTHWRWCDALHERFPDITVLRDPIFVRDGDIWSSAGVTAGIDLALAMVEADIGHQAALDVARELVVYLKRPGGQAQFSAVLTAQTADGTGIFDALHAWIAGHLSTDLRVEKLAKHAGMSPRNFARTYTARTGSTPARTVETMRIEAAKRLLEEGVTAVGPIAVRCGFGNEERMRRSFVRHVGVPPTDYRKRFTTSANMNPQS